MTNAKADPSVTDVMSPTNPSLGNPNHQLTSSESDSCFAKKVAIEHKKTILFNKAKELKKAVKLNIDSVDVESSFGSSSDNSLKSPSVANGQNEWISPNQKGDQQNSSNSKITLNSSSARQKRMKLKQIGEMPQSQEFSDSSYDTKR